LDQLQRTQTRLHKTPRIRLVAILVALGAQGLAYAQGAPVASGTVTHAVDARQ
jgi:hypothetical protein